MGYVEDVNIYMNKDEIRVSIKKATGINVADLIEKLEEKRVIGSRAITKKEKKDDQ